MLTAVTLFWASSFILIKVGLQGVSPLTFAVLRFVIASMALLPILPLTGGMDALRSSSNLDRLKFVVLGLCGVTFFNVLQFVGLSLTTATNASILLNTNPIFISVLSLVFLRERLKLSNGFGITLALIGIITVMSGGRLSSAAFSSSTFSGDLLIVGSAVCWAIYTVLGKSVLERYRPMAVTIINMAIGTFFLLVIALAVEDLGIAARVSAEVWVIILYLAFFCSGLAYILWYESLSDLAASRAGAFLFTIPVYTTLMAHFAIGEAITGSTVIGTALVIIGVYLAEKV